MKTVFDVVVVGGGVIGASVGFHLAKLGCDRVLVLDRGEFGGGGTGKSCAIIRTHYSVPLNAALAVASLGVFRDFQNYLGQDDVDSGFINSGYLIVADEGDTADKLTMNLVAQRDIGANTLMVSAEDASRLHPLLNFDDIAAIAYEPDSGYADPYLTTSAFITAARRLGVEVRTRTPVLGVLQDGSTVRGVETPDGPIDAGTVVCVMGPWTTQLAEWIGADLPLEVSRHTVLTFKGDAPYSQTLPTVKDFTTENNMYFRPGPGGSVLVGTGDYGEPIQRPDDMSAPLDPELVYLQGSQIAKRMPSFADARLAGSWYGPYDITPDWHPVMGPVDGTDGIYLAYGFSGHGFKLAPAVGLTIAQSVLGQATDFDMSPYRLSRFSEGALLGYGQGIGSAGKHGYGIGAFA